MTPSPACLSLIRRFESCCLTAYWDSLGAVWTIGWGHTGPEVHAGLVWTQEQADEALEHDAQAAGLAVMRLVDIQMTQGEFDALTDFVFNEGAGRLASSTLLKLMNGGDIVGAGNQLLRWDWAGGKVVAGLAERRQAELQLWNS